MNEPASEQNVLLSADIEKNIGNRLWRLNNLYKTVNEDGKAVTFRLRVAQMYLYTHMAYRNVILKARQLGFSTFIQILGLDYILWNKNRRAHIIAHGKDEAQDIFRDKVQYAYENLPEEVKLMRPAERNRDGLLRLKNNSQMKVSTSPRSGAANFVHVSELGKICKKYPHKAKEIKTGTIPACHEGAYIFIESTAEGPEGYFHDVCEESRNRMLAGIDPNNMEFKFHFFPWYDNPSNVLSAPVKINRRLTKYFKETNAECGINLTKEQRNWYVVEEKNLGEEGDDMKREHPRSPEEAFAQSIEGAYFKTQMDICTEDGRIRDLPYNKRYPVITTWDIGADTTAICFIQRIGKWYHYIDYLEDSVDGMPRYMEELKKKAYKYGLFIGPHDMKHTEWGTGKTRLETAIQDHGVNFSLAPNMSLDDGIDASRRFLQYCVFDQSKCERLIKCLRSFRKKWDEKNGVWMSKPVHDWSSHGADSFRYGAISDLTVKVDQSTMPVNKGAVSGPLY